MMFLSKERFTVLPWRTKVNVRVSMPISQTVGMFRKEHHFNRTIQQLESHIARVFTPTALPREMIRATEGRRDCQ